MGAKAAGSHGQAETKAHKTQNASQPNNDSQRTSAQQKEEQKQLQVTMRLISMPSRR